MFFSLGEAMDAIIERREELNDKPFQKLPGSRNTRFEELDKPLLKPLPLDRWVYSVWKTAKVSKNCHIAVDSHNYSVPHKYVGQRLDVKLTDSTVMIFKDRACIWTHVRKYKKHGYTTVGEHLPKSHQKYQGWTPEQLISWGAQIGPFAAQWAEGVMARRAHPEQGYQAILGVMRLEEKYGRQRLEAACHRALASGCYTSKSVKLILTNNLDKVLPAVEHDELLGIVQSPDDQYCIEPTDQYSDDVHNGMHDNVRGAEYYSNITQSCE